MAALCLCVLFTQQYYRKSNFHFSIAARLQFSPRYLTREIYIDISHISHRFLRAFITIFCRSDGYLVAVNWCRHALQHQGQFITDRTSQRSTYRSLRLPHTDTAAQVKGMLGLIGSYGRSYLTRQSAGLVSVLRSLLPPYNIKGKWTPVWPSPQ